MERTGTNSNMSLRAKLIWIVLVAFFLAASFMVASTVYSLRLVEEQTSTVYKEIVNTYLERVEGTFSMVERQLHEVTSYETELLLIGQGADTNQTKLAQTKMMDFLSTEANLYTDMDGFFLYFPSSESYLEGSSLSTLLGERLIFRENLRAYLSGDSQEVELKQWLPFQAGKENYFLRTVRFGGSYFGAWVSTSRLLSQLGANGMDKTEDYVLFATSVGEPLTVDPSLPWENVRFDGDGESSYFSNGYLVAEAVSSYGEFKMLTLVSSSALYANLYIMCGIGVAFIAAFLLMIPVITLTMYRWVVRPVNSLVEAMDRLKQGNLDSRPHREHLCKEFQILNASFTAMSVQIKELKLSVYEEKLRKQRTQLNYYQLQIHPHFFANSLNMIYNFAQAKQYGLVQELAVDLCEYYRYTIRNTGSFVPLQSELEHLNRYLGIQKMRFGDQLVVEFAVAPQYRELQIPPLIIETFVENAIKYAMSMERLTRICVTVKPAAERGMVCIQVADNGPGFSEELMEEILSGKTADSSEAKQGRRLGIYNVQQRLWLLYGDQAQLSMTNLEPHGTLAEILLPEKGEEQDD